ncbi:MAG: hypothetical protein SPI65_04640 [Peptoniphilus sp.]|nr:hypothetical protein [Peptoniphilus sp.]MDD7363443.1 hypothetical protein [Bacillota bacterium]MDY6044853.1 hypothetical protein [Peptoniphilus sp.]
MEQLIRGVIELDERTDKMVREKEASIEEDKSGLQKRFSEMEADERESSKKAAKESYDEIYSDAMDVVDKIKEKNHLKLEQVDDIYKKHKDELVEEAFRLLDI